MKFYALYPDIPGELGSRTRYSSDKELREIIRPQCKFLDWGEDDLVKIGCYLASEKLKQAIEIQKCSGCRFGEVDTVRTGAAALYVNNKMEHFPSWTWLQPVGQAGVEDFGIDEERRLVVSQNVLNILRQFCIKNAEVYELNDAPSLEARQNDIYRQMEIFAEKIRGKP